MRVTVATREAIALLERELSGTRELPKQLKIWGLSVTELTRANARAKGGRSFWRDVVAGSIEWESNDQSAKVGIADTYDGRIAAHKQLGGVIRPKNKKYLTIPISDFARGRRVADFSSYKVYARGKVLGYNDGGKNFVPLFAMVKQVRQSASPFLPTDDEVADIGVKLLENKV